MDLLFMFGTDGLEDLDQEDEEYHGKYHDEIFIAVVTIIDGDLTQTAAADDTAHSGVSQNGGYGDGGIGDQRRDALGDHDLHDDLKRRSTHALRHLDRIRIDFAQTGFSKSGYKGECSNYQRHDGCGSTRQENRLSKLHMSITGHHYAFILFSLGHDDFLKLMNLDERLFDHSAGI